MDFCMGQSLRRRKIVHSATARTKHVYVSVTVRKTRNDQAALFTSSSTPLQSAWKKVPGTMLFVRKRSQPKMSEGKKTRSRSGLGTKRTWTRAKSTEVRTIET